MHVTVQTYRGKIGDQRGPAYLTSGKVAVREDLMDRPILYHDDSRTDLVAQ